LNQDNKIDYFDPDNSSQLTRINKGVSKECFNTKSEQRRLWESKNWSRMAYMKRKRRQRNWKHRKMWVESSRKRNSMFCIRFCSQKNILVCFVYFLYYILVYFFLIFLSLQIAYTIFIYIISNLKQF